MTRVVRIQLFILVSYVAVHVALFFWAQNFVQQPQLQLFVALNAAFIAFWLWVLVRAPPPRQRWVLLDPRTTAAANLPMVASVFLLLPPAENPLRLAAAVFALGATAVLVFGSIQKPPAPDTRIGALSPLGLPVAMVLFFFTHPAPYALPIAIFLAAATVALLAARGLIQEIFNSAHAANLTASAALAEAFADRQARTRFLESASHDLGQPLQAARLFFNAAINSATAAARAAAARKVEWALDATQNQLAQMLEHLRLEAGALAPRMAHLPLDAFLQQLAEVHQPALPDTRTKIQAARTSLCIISDPMLLQRALSNLVTNALRHANARNISIRAEATADKVRLWVLDDGTGIPPEDAAQLFEAYFQGSNHGDTIRGGFGIGLASVRRIAALLGGSCGYQPRRRGGSAFWLALPRFSAKNEEDAQLPHLR